MTPLELEIRSLEGNLASALEVLRIPAYLVDAEGRVRWINGAARSIGGDVVGRPFAELVSPGDRMSARTAFSQKLLGSVEATDVELVLLTADGTPVPAEISSAAVRDGERIVAVFGLVRVMKASASPEATPRLTRRHREVLTLLAEGKSTAEIAATLGLATETVRNHVRGLLRELEVHTRLQAVVRAAQLGLVEY